MTNQQHPIAPPPELVQQWINDGPPLNQPKFVAHYVATHAAQWGADQELEACLETIRANKWFANPDYRCAELRAARRPKPPSLAEEALEALDEADSGLITESEWPQRSKSIRRALERLQELEGGQSESIKDRIAKADAAIEASMKRIRFIAAIPARILQTYRLGATPEPAALPVPEQEVSQ